VGQSTRQIIVVDFSVFNELSLPLNVRTAQAKFGLFFELLKELSEKGLNQIRMSDNFKNYSILKDVTFYQFLGQADRDFQTRLKSFINNQVIKISNPIIQEEDSEQRKAQQVSKYSYDNNPTAGGLACCDIWDTIAVSFDSDEWGNSNIDIQKKSIDESANTPISVKHASKKAHLSSHQNFFNALEKEAKLGITKENLWLKKDSFFPEIIVFCPEIEQQIKTIDKTIFTRAISILRDIERKQKKITDFNCSPESQTVSQKPKLKRYRMFTVDGERKFFTNHIKNLSSGYRIYFFEKENKIYIGYIGKHLPLQ
jgi:hypothetical protein